METLQTPYNKLWPLRFFELAFFLPDLSKNLFAKIMGAVSTVSFPF